MGNCLDCGELVYRGLCVNCHEENYIEDQYLDLDLPVPESIYEKARKNERDIYLDPVDNIKTVTNDKERGEYENESR